MNEKGIFEKLKEEIAQREESYQQELKKIKKEDDLLGYIKGMLDITEDNVSNFPYYDEEHLTKEEKEASDEFNIMLKYTLKEDKIIASFKSELKNLYFLEKIGYQQAEQYQDIKRKLEDYRIKIKEAYDELIKNETLKTASAKKETILKKLDKIQEKLNNPKEELENIDEFYEGLQYANLSEKDKTDILVSILKNNIKFEQEKIDKLNHLDKKVERIIGKIKQENIERIRDAVKNLETKFNIKITYPKTYLGKHILNTDRFLFSDIEE